MASSLDCLKFVTFMLMAMIIWVLSFRRWLLERDAVGILLTRGHAGWGGPSVFTVMCSVFKEGIAFGKGPRGSYSLFQKEGIPIGLCIE